MPRLELLMVTLRPVGHLGHRFTALSRATTPGGCAVTSGRRIQQMIHGKSAVRAHAKELKADCRAIGLDVQRFLALRPYEPSLLTTLMLRT